MNMAGFLLFCVFLVLNPSVFAQVTEEIVVKATDAVMFQMTANMKLTQDQLEAIRPIVTDNIVKIRDLQLGLQRGDIDGKTMYNQREQLIEEEDRKLSYILTKDQMKVWINIQDQ